MLAEEVAKLHAEFDHTIEDRVDERLRNIPPVVKVAASQVQSTVDTTVSTITPELLTADKKLFADIASVVEKYHVQKKVVV